MSEKIKCAAIQYYLKSDPDTPRITWGANHAQCINWFSFADIYTSERIMDKELQGFLTTEDRFADRKEAYQIAKREGQLHFEREDGVLFSEFCDYATEVPKAWIKRLSWQRAVCPYCSFEMKIRDEATSLPDQCPNCGKSVVGLTRDLRPQ